MALTTAEIQEVLAEIAPLLVGGRVQKVYQPHDEAISLEIRAQGKPRMLYFSTDPETARLHFLSKKPPNPPTPPQFCQLLRAHLEGARIEHIDQVGDDRIVRLDMQCDGKPITLVAELTGRTANVMLLDEGGAVRGQLRKGRLKPGETYVPPVSRAKEASKDSNNQTTRTAHQTANEFPISAEVEGRYQERDEARARV